MNCPKCGEPMVEGKTQVRGTVLGFLFYGVSNQHLYFDTDERRGEKIIKSCDIHDAERCRACDLTVIQGLDLAALW